MATPRTTWQRIAEDLAQRIRSGETPVGSKIPSYRQLVERYESALGTVKRAIEFLQEAGVLEGAPGTGVFVVRVPERDLDFVVPVEVTRRVARLERSVATLERKLVALYDQTGHPYPSD